LDFGYAKSGVVNYPTIVENESCKNDSNESYTIQTWSTRKFLTALV
jgi:hypothetical protein